MFARVSKPSPLVLTTERKISTDSGPCQPAFITKDGDIYRIVIPCVAVDPRQVYVFAAPRSVSVEIRWQVTAAHADHEPEVTETIASRRLREFEFPVDIDSTATSVEVGGDYVEIIAPRAVESGSDVRPHLVEFERHARLSLSAAG